MLQISKINKSFGGLKVLNNLSFKIEKGSISGLIGPNGAGKTTLFNVINGSIKPDSGSVQLNNYELIGLQPHELFEIGVLRTFQIPHEFFSLTVLDNLLVVPPNKIGETFFGQWFFEKNQHHAFEMQSDPMRSTLGFEYLDNPRPLAPFHFAKAKPRCSCQFSSVYRRR